MSIQTRIRALFKKKKKYYRNKDQLGFMYSSAAKSCAYVAEATPWSPLCTALDVCMRVCVGGRGGAGGGGSGVSRSKAGAGGVRWR